MATEVERPNDVHTPVCNSLVHTLDTCRSHTNMLENDNPLPSDFESSSPSSQDSYSY
jgi:hypothetical protein